MPRKKIPPSLWEGIIMARWEGKSHREIAIQLGVHETTIAKLERENKEYQKFRDKVHSAIAQLTAEKLLKKNLSHELGH